MTKLLVYANCQSEPVDIFMRDLCDKLETVPLEPIYKLTQNDALTVDAAFAAADIIVHQPIGANYGPLSTAALKAAHPDKTYVSFPSIYFNGYFPNLMYLRLPEGGTLPSILASYHDRRIVEAFIAGKSADEAVASLDESALDPVAAVERSIGNARKADEATEIKVASLIADDFHQRRLFYTFNHPSNSLLLDVAIQACSLLNLQISPSGLRTALRRPTILDIAQVAIEQSTIDTFKIGFGGANQMFEMGAFEKQELSRSRWVEASYAQYAARPDIAEVLTFADQRTALFGY